MARNPLIALLNQDLSDELGSIIQYLHHHWTAEGIDAAAVIEMFEGTAREEMQHAEKLAERIVQLGGDPTTAVGKVKKGGNLKRMIEDDLAGEQMAVARYKAHIKRAAAAGDSTTRLLLEEILHDEEEHVDRWLTLLARRP
jgi:bacterioferritin